MLAAATGRSLTDIVEEALRERLARRQEYQKRERFPLVTFGGGGIRPGVDLNDSAGLLEIMEQDDAAP